MPGTSNREANEYKLAKKMKKCQSLEDEIASNAYMQ